MKLFTTAIVSLLAAHAAASDVFTLTKASFDDFIGDHPLVLAEFFAPWCGHCKALAPEYEQAATILKEKGSEIALAKIDCTVDSELCSEHGIEGFPTLKVFRGPESVSPYGGQRKSDSIVSYMVKQSLPAVSVIADKEKLDSFKAADDIVIVGYFSDKESNFTFEKVAESLRDNFLFGAISDAELTKAEGVAEVPGVIVYKSFDDGKAVYSGEFSADNLIKFAKSESIPLMGEIGPSTYLSYIESGVPLAYIFVETSEQKESFIKSLTPIAKKYKGKVNIATIDAVAFGQHADNLNLKQQWPAFAIQDVETNLKYTFDQTKEITASDLDKFIMKFIEGEIKPTIKSQEAPEVQEGPVIVVTANTYEEIVMDSTKDVLVEYYATWCGHCKNLAPKYEELGAIFWNNADAKSKVLIAKIDTPNNDVPEDIRGFPTIKLFPANDKENPIEYTGPRTVEGLADFIKENGQFSVDGNAINALKSEQYEDAPDVADEHDEL
ncbi:thioredoxin-like domain-containing protein [Dipodascopsis tothii]|uniref:thioredoxin-like domain-containing protein n=1 Tax=Dipodascopsis tothii TaxID=44089 RepID=UPI0034CEE294